MKKSALEWSHEEIYRLKKSNGRMEAMISELESFIESNCYDTPGQASVRAKKLLDRLRRERYAL